MSHVTLTGQRQRRSRDLRLQVIGRVKMNKVLNAPAWESRETYLKVEVDYQEDLLEVREL